MYSAQSFGAQSVIDAQKGLLRHAEYDLALEKLEQTRKVMPNYPDLWERRGKVLLLMSFFRQKPELAQEAERSYRQAALLEPLSSQRWSDLAEAQILLKNNSAALNSVARGLARDPYNAALHFYKGRAWQNLGDFAQSRKAYQASVDILPKGDAKYALKELEATQ